MPGMLRPACWLVLSAALFAAPIALAQSPNEEQAIKLYSDGRAKLEAGKADQALPLLKQSLALLPSPNTELLIAHALRKQGKNAQALDYYDRARASADAGIARGEDRYTATRMDATKSAAELAGSIGTLDVQAPAGSRITVFRSADDAVVLEGPGRVRVDPGSVKITYSNGSDVQEKTVQVRAGTIEGVSFLRGSTGDGGGETTAGAGPVEGGAAPPPASAASPVGPLTIAGSVAGGLGLVGFGVFAWAGVTASNKYSELEECGVSCDTIDLARAEELRDEGERAQLIANVSVGIGAALLATGVALIIVDVVDGPSQSSAATTVVPIAAPLEGGAFVGLAVSGL